MSIDSKYLNAVNILASAKIDALQNIYVAFRGDFERAWKSNLNKFLPREPGPDGKLISIDYEKERKRIDPDKEFELLTKGDIKIVTVLDKKYPKPLKEIAHPPFLLYVRGSLDILSSQCFGIVGTRALTDYGRRATPKIAGEIAKAGFTIASGLARGIDTLAHQAALDAKKPTIAVLGCGLSWNVFYPPQNRKLAGEIIAGGGAIISEYGFNMNSSPITFPQRNRIISGLSRGVLVVEADIKSGALITARCAVDQNRDVFAVPGSIFSPVSVGTNLYIKKGAKPVTSAEDILTEYGISYNDTRRAIVPENETEAKILKILSHEPVHIDEIIRRSGYDVGAIQATLVMMELSDKIKNIGGNRYVMM